MIQPDVVFHSLGIVITDEQHRFGVEQRHMLSSKGDNPNVCVMTATPIPRTLAVVLYGELDISVIDTMPASRRPIITKAADNRSRDRVYREVEKELDQGHQAYVVTPLIEDSEQVDARSAQDVYKELYQRFRDYRVGLIYGSLDQAKKEQTMEAFAEGSIDVLVSTVVIEVGINVPNATVMVIENAERFGLAQLHQLRGRVGRGAAQSYCYLVQGSASEISQIREVRAFLVAQQQAMGKAKGIVMDGRDIGTVVFPNAELKLFLTASPEVRAQRRYDELVGKGETPNYEAVLADVNERDYRDTHRAESPLRQAEDAIVVDNSHMTPDEQMNVIYGLFDKAVNH